MYGYLGTEWWISRLQHIDRNRLTIPQTNLTEEVSEKMERRGSGEMLLVSLLVT